MTPDQLAAIAAQLVARIRDDSTDANGQWLADNCPDPADWWELCFVLAAAVPDDKPWSELTAWARRTSRELAPHGTPAAMRRHQYHSEPACEPCKAWDRDRKHRARATRVASMSDPGISVVA